MQSAIRSPSQLAQFLKQSRKSRKLSQKELADLAGVPQVTISSIESGARNPSIPTLFSLLVAMDLELAAQARPKGK